jgi:hypothetical protein
MLETARTGSQRFYRCEGCGFESWILVTEGTYTLDGTLRQTDPCFHLTGRWKAKPELKQVALVAKLFPHLQAAGFSALWRSAMAHEDIEFGLFNQTNADELVRKLHAIGLDATLKLDMYSLPLVHDSQQ